MNLINSILLLQSIIGVFLLGLAVYSYRFRDSKLGTSLAAFLLLTAFWCFVSSIIGQSEGIATKIFLNRIKLLAPIILPACILNLAIDINGEIKINRLLLFLPAIIFTFIVMSPWHEIFITGYALEQIQGQDILVFKNGSLFSTHSNLSRIFCLFSFWIIYRGTQGKHRFQKNTGWMINTAILIPFLVDSIAVYFYEPFRYLQIVPVSLGFTCVVITYALFVHGTLEVIPYARSQVVSVLSDPCFMWNLKRKLVDINDAGSRLFHIENLRDFNESQYPFLYANNQEVKWIDGRIFQVRFEDVKDLSGKVVGSFSLLRDISQIKIAEENLHKMNQMKTNILGVISHDLCGHAGQLSFITELLSTSHKQLSSKEQIDLLEGAAFLSKDLNFFLSNLLDWSADQYDNWKIKNEMINLSLLILSIRSFFEKSASLKNQQLIIEVDDSVYVYSDNQMLEIIIRNLIYNAFKHSPSESLIKVWIEENDIHIWNQSEDFDVIQMNEYFSREDYAQPNSNGLGHKICKEFSRALSIQIRASVKENGVSFILSNVQIKRSKEMIQI